MLSRIPATCGINSSAFRSASRALSTACAAYTPRPDSRKLRQLSHRSPAPAGSRVLLHPAVPARARPARAETSSPDRPASPPPEPLKRPPGAAFALLQVHSARANSPTAPTTAAPRRNLVPPFARLTLVVL